MPLLQIQNLAWLRAGRNLPRMLRHDDGQDEANAELILGGPNGHLSLREAQINFKLIGASDERRKSRARRPNPTKLERNTIAQSFRWSSLRLPSLGRFFFHDRGIAISLIGYHSPAPCQACQNRRFGAALRQKHEAMTFIGLSSASICWIHHVSLHEGFLRPISRMRRERRRTRLLTEGSLLSGISGIGLSCDPAFGGRLINTRSGGVISGNFYSRTIAIRACG